MRKIKVLIVDDHHLFRLGVTNILQNNKQHPIEIVGDCSDGIRAVEETMRHQPDVVLLDIHLPNLDGIEVARQILQVLPKTRILALSSSHDNYTILSMIKAGASGYVIKDINTSELINAVITINEGNTYYSKEASSAVLASLSERDKPKNSNEPVVLLPEQVLTKRELEILRLIAEEKGNQDIAKALYVSPRTVETHKRNILLKLKIKNIAGLVKYYLKFNDEVRMIQ
jgi:DNA-binding NarL/FixJ family response regulator